MAGLALWVTVIVVAAGRRPDKQTWIGTTAMDTVLLVAACIYVFAVLGFMIWVGRGDRPIETQRQRNWGSPAAILLIGLALFVWDAAGLSLEFPQTPPAEPQSNADVAFGAADASDVEEAPTPVVELRDLILVAVLAVGTGFAAVLFSRRSNAESEVDTHDEAEQYAEALVTARRRLRTDGEPRSAILAAYAELEASLEEIGEGRDPADTVAEHHRRVLDRHRLDARPFEVLASLYRSARFSTASVNEADRRAALAALDEAVGAIGEPA